jgi:hypothetical protein
MNTKELTNDIRKCNLLIQAGITSLDSLLSLKEEDFEMVYGLCKWMVEDVR